MNIPVGGGGRGGATCGVGGWGIDGVCPPYELFNRIPNMFRFTKTFVTSFTLSKRPMAADFQAIMAPESSIFKTMDFPVSTNILIDDFSLSQA